MLNVMATDISAILDIVALVFLGAFAIRGFIKGFVFSFFSTFGTVIAFVFAILLASKVSLFLESQFSLITVLSDKIGGFLTGQFGDELMNTTLEAATGETMAQLGLFAWLIDLVLSIRNGRQIPSNLTLNEVLCPTFAYYAAMIISVIGLFIIFKLILFVVGKILNSFCKFKLFWLLDKSLGIAFGIISGFSFLNMIFMAINYIPLPFLADISTAIATGKVTGFVQQINVYHFIIIAVSEIDLVGVLKSMLNVA